MQGLAWIGSEFFILNIVQKRVSDALERNAIWWFLRSDNTTDGHTTFPPLWTDLIWCQSYVIEQDIGCSTCGARVFHLDRHVRRRRNERGRSVCFVAGGVFWSYRWEVGNVAPENAFVVGVDVKRASRPVVALIRPERESNCVGL